MFSYAAPLFFVSLLSSEVLSAPLSSSKSLCSWNSFTLHPDDGGIWPYRSYQSSNATSPEFVIEQNNQTLSDGLIFLTPTNGGLFGSPGIKQPGTIMMTDQGDLTWFGPVGNTSNFRQQTFHGRPVITYWTGSGAAASNGAAAHGYGSVQILDTNYTTIATVCPKLNNITFPPGQTYPCVADVHESYITPSNTMVVTVYNITQADLSSIGGLKDGWLLNPIAVEVDLATNEPLFIWNPLDHVSLTSSNEPLMGSGNNASNPYDWFHMNSIQPYKDAFFINSRQTWSTYLVKRDGTIEWEINGRTGGDLGILPAEAQFSWQHYARIRDAGDDSAIVTYFADNNGNPLTRKPSVGLGLRVNLPPNKKTPPTVSTHLVDPDDHVFAYAEGSYADGLANGDTFVAYGTNPVLKEFGPESASGKDVRWSAQFGYVNYNNTASSYRAYKQVWHATPSTAPELVIGKAKNGKTSEIDCATKATQYGYVSWNGATDVTEYKLYAGSKKNDLQAVGKFVDEGFETGFAIPTQGGFVQVAALEGGREVRRSQVVEIS